MKENNIDRWIGSALYSEYYFENLVKNNPLLLVKLIESGDLDKVDLTYAAEILGHSDDSVLVRKVLMPLLDHQSPIVREGVIYGLTRHMDELVKEKLCDLMISDSSDTIRDIAKETLEENDYE